MKLRTPNTFSWSCRSLQEAKEPRAASRLTGEEGWCSAWLRVPNNKGNIVTGSDNLGGQGKGNKKKYTFGIFTFFFFLFASLHCVTKYISARSHILVQ